MAKMTKAEKDIAIKTQAVNAMTIPENAIQIGDFSYAIPATVDGEIRYAVVTFTAKNNKDTKSAPAFDPEETRAAWIADKEEKARKAQEKAEEKARKEKARAAKKEQTAE